jgi:hypothetical protein
MEGENCVFGRKKTREGGEFYLFIFSWHDTSTFFIILIKTLPTSVFFIHHLTISTILTQK